MTLSAFNAQSAIREGALERLTNHAKAKHLQNGALLWDGEKGSVAGCLVEHSDPAEWEARLGLARWMAYAIDTVTGRLGPERALEEVTALLHAIQVGCDTGAMGNLLICKLLEKVTILHAPEGPMKNALVSIVGLHQRRLRGEGVAAAEWKQARRAATDATDALLQSPVEGGDAEHDSGRVSVVGAAIEAAAWDPLLSPTAVSEVLRQWLNLEGMKADEEFGWTPEDDTLIRNALEEMHVRYIEPNPEETRDVFELLEEHHPDVAARLRAQVKHGNDYWVICADRACELLRHLLSTPT